MNSKSFIDSLSDSVFADNAAFPFSEKTHPIVVKNPQLYRNRYKSQLSIFDIFKFNKLKIADIGGGIGAHAEFMRRKGHDVYMFEPNTKYCELASKHFPDLRIVNDYFGDDVFDIITMFSPETSFVDNVNKNSSFLKRNCVAIIIDQRAIKFNEMISEIKNRIVYRHDHFTHDCLRRTLMIRTFQIESEMLKDHIFE
jgi:hypothetical protein